MRKHEPNQIDFIEFPAKSVAEVQATRGFYQSVFGWTYRDFGDNYVDTLDSGVNTGINGDAGQRPKHPLAVVYVSDLEAARRQVVRFDGRISTDIFSFPGGRRFHFVDPAGNELAVWSDR